MALHSDTEIYKAVIDLAAFSLRAARQMPRDVKMLVGAHLRDETVWMAVLVQRTNIARDAAKLPHLVELLEHLEIVKVTLQLARDLGFIAPKTYGDAMPLVASVGKQANALRNHFAAA